ncbi:MAG: L-rhamnose isomerase [Planctomyces sp.]|nr:L-rhamnose isomerase [Planctomyces sp.]
MMTSSQSIESAYQAAKERYAELGVDCDQALLRLSAVKLSLHCWQGDDVAGFERLSGESASQDIGGGLAVTGNYPGRARTPNELRADAEQAFSLIPGKHRFNLHASYAETGGETVQRSELRPEHFAAWMEWARDRGLGLDFNPTFFGHPLASDGFTLSHHQRSIREFWIQHGIVCREIAAEMGRFVGQPCVNNVWIPDGMKDSPFDRSAPRQRLLEALDQVFADPMNPSHVLDAVECKLFGLGSESYVVGSHEFYLGYAITRRKLLCLDAGHFHPTEVISDKISSVLNYVEGLLLHVSRGVRWDSDHVVTLTDELLAIAQELVRGGYLGRVQPGLDFFDASINRIAAWVIGARNLLKALLIALLEPADTLRALEVAGDYTGRLAMLEELRFMPFAAIWDYHCLNSDVPTGHRWLDDVRDYEARTVSQRTAKSRKD